jgi:predicted transcriptional regulator
VKEHAGKKVESAIRVSGMSITIVASKLGITRRTLYNYFESASLDPRIISKIEKIIHIRIHDHSSVQTSEDKTTSPSDSIEYWRTKYIELLEKYTQLLEEKQQ